MPVDITGASKVVELFRLGYVRLGLACCLNLDNVMPQPGSAFQITWLCFLYSVR
jgi:hypothetical protein